MKEEECIAADHFTAQLVAQLRRRPRAQIEFPNLPLFGQCAGSKLQGNICLLNTHAVHPIDPVVQLDKKTARDTTERSLRQTSCATG